MSRFLNTSGNDIIAIAVCDRCRMKRAYVDLGPDPNNPGLRVCRFDCADELDPYRLPAPPPDIITLEYPRPDEAITMPDVMVDELGYDIVWDVNPLSGPINISKKRDA